MGQAETGQALAGSDDRWEALCENFPFGLAIVDAEGRYQAANARFRAILGYSQEQLRSEALTHLTGQPDVSTKAALTRLTRRERDNLTFERYYPRQDGTLLWLNVYVSLVPETPKTPPFLSVVVEDLTERRKSEEALQNQERHARALLELSKSFAAHLELPELVRSLAVGLRRLLPYDALILFLPDTENRTRVYFSRIANGQTAVEEHVFRDVQGSVAGPVFNNAKPLSYTGIPPWVSSDTRNLLETEALNSGCAVPLVRGEHVIAGLTLASFKDNAFAQKDLDLLMQVGTQVAVAVENAERFRRLNESRKRLAGERLYFEDELRLERDFDDIVGQSLGLKYVLEQVRTVAATDTAVLILGETGTGKELIARLIHKLSSRRNHALVRADCAAIPAGLLESELFGHEKGAFTGAIARNLGRIELASKGTLFLDEVGDIPMELQSKLLRVLQEREFERLGSTRTIRADFRLVAATHRDLLQMVEQGQFRRDLYYRLNVFPIRIPPLRERADDIPLLVWHFVRQYARRMNRQIDKIRPEDMNRVMRHSWPGNVRELQNIIERSVVGSPSGVLELAPFTELVRPHDQPAAEIRTLAAAEREHILNALRDTDWVIAGPHGAAQRLGVRRTTLLYKMRRLGITRPPR